MIAELSTFDGIAFYGTCKATSDVRVVKIEFDIFKTKMLYRQNISYSFIESLLQKIKILEGFIQKELLS
jgi:CRP-like cAMP-binding protein